jgi:hypothetical protein
MRGTERAPDSLSHPFPLLPLGRCLPPAITPR